MELNICKMAEEAAFHYEKVADVFRVFQHLFPHPHGGDPNDVENANEAIRLLENAKENEAIGVVLLERMYTELLQGEKN
jgi:hypothetical protein